MTPQMIQQIKNNPKYQELVSKRSSFAWKLSIIMLVVYYAFIMVIAFKPGLLATRIGNSVMTVGIPIGIFIILLSFLLAGIYVRRANGEFDQLTKEIRTQFEKKN
jgi:uncharacterized membrane protein (DUF485 family)